ncbi:type II toxin-antitoxin system VapB family antitoxin [Nocardia callitridis]|uniref:Type II toxin-antitoxin system VapB family antitoxin n=1 Tax=Nocardia callitridis TaxID=648753 RepID=A0ABP9KCB5_9NOCA
MIDLDDDLLSKAAQELGTATKKDTVHAALRVALRQSAARNLRAMMVGDSDGLAHEAKVNAMWEGGERAQTS